MPSKRITTEEPIQLPIDPDKLKSERTGKKLSQFELAQRAGVNEKTIRRLEKCRHRDGTGIPDPNYAMAATAEALAGALGSSVQSLCGASRFTRDAGRDANAPQARLKNSARRFLDLAEDLNRILSPSNLLSVFIGNYWDWVTRGVVVNGPNRRVEVSFDAFDYRPLLRRLPEEVRRGVYAIADLTDETEKDLWLTADARSADARPGWTWVGERIFLVPWAMVHDDEAMSQLVNLLRMQSQHRPDEHTVRLGVIDPTCNPINHHPLGHGAVGRHLLLHGASALFGGYKQNLSTRQIKNVLVSDPEAYESAATDFYESISDDTFVIKPNDDFESIHRSINEKYELGTFEEPWASQPTPEREPKYFFGFTRNIRRWEPDYDAMTIACARVIKHEVIRRFNTGRAPSVILEIGVGDGGLTQHVAPWCDDKNEELKQLEYATSYVECYLGIEMARGMIERLPPELLRCQCLHVEQGRFPTDYKHILKGRKAHILCGQLVAHDLIGELIEECWQNVHDFLAAARECLTDDGAAFFADSFTSPDPTIRDMQVKYWKRTMVKRRGLTPHTASDFVDRNPEMVRTLNESHLGRLAAEYGFQWEFLPASITSHSRILRLWR